MRVIVFKEENYDKILAVMGIRKGRADALLRTKVYTKKYENPFFVMDYHQGERAKRFGPWVIMDREMFANRFVFDTRRVENEFVPAVERTKKDFV